MARITAEDCILKVPNRFELVMYAAQRARGISAGAQLTVDRDNDKNSVVSLREIAETTVDTGELEESIIKSLQKHVEMDEPEEDEMDILAIQQELMGESVEENSTADAAEEGDATEEDGADIAFEDEESITDDGGDIGEGGDAEDPKED